MRCSAWFMDYRCTHWGASSGAVHTRVVVCLFLACVCTMHGLPVIGTSGLRVSRNCSEGFTCLDTQGSRTDSTTRTLLYRALQRSCLAKITHEVLPLNQLLIG